MNETLHAFTSAYPRKGDAAAIWLEWQAQVLKGVNPQDIIDGAKHYAEYCAVSQTPVQFITSPVRWLKERRWLERPEVRPKFKDLPAASDYRWTANRQNDPINSRPLFWWAKPKNLWPSGVTEADIPEQYRETVQAAHARRS